MFASHSSFPLSSLSELSYWQDPTSQSTLGTNGFESEVAHEAQPNEDSDDDKDTEKKVEESWSMSNLEHRVRCTKYPSRAARASITALGAGLSLTFSPLPY
jgi:hypothetical protein